MVALGMPNKVIGAKLFITEKTVKTHTNHIFRKLGVVSRLQATLVFQSYQRTIAAESMNRRKRK
jgi:DNA-binding NarL/FixJ family response regulator